MLLTHQEILVRHAVSSFLLLAGFAGGQTRSRALPRFEDYPAREIFAGTIAAPKLVTSDEQRYADQIRGEYEGEKGPNFAGSMVVIHWACGAPCMRMAIVDAKTGDVYFPPISINGVGARSFDMPLLAVGEANTQNPEIQFRPNSDLMSIKATPDYLVNRLSFTYYFLWRQNRWTLLRKVPLDQR
jgi:hypothetical protein